MLPLALVLARPDGAGAQTLPPAPPSAGPVGLDAGAPPPPVPPSVISRDSAGQATIRAQRIDTALRIDGRLDDTAYALPSFSGFIQADPVAGAPATERTEAWIFFDDDNVYVAARCWETHPELITASDMLRDSPSIRFSDMVAFAFDTFYDRRNGVTFTVNAIGGRNDGQITDERQFNIDFNPLWTVRTGRFEHGWTMEAAVPFKSLRYPSRPAQVWGFIMRRQNRWKNETSYVIPIPAAHADRGIMMLSAGATLVGIEAPRTSRGLEIKPYAIGDLTTDRSTGLGSRGNAAAGVDVKYSVAKSVTADFTYNTDFAQVEADEQQINLTRFNLFFPEKREFFLENGGIFHFGGGNSFGGSTTVDNVPVLFYSRRIGLSDTGIVPIDAGARVTGRIGPFTVGAVDIQTAPSGRIAGTNFSALRLKRNVLRRSNVGVIYTGRSHTQATGDRNDVYGADASFSFFDNLNAYTYWARSRTPGLDGDDASYRGELDYAGDRYGAQARYLAVGANFSPDIGFVRRRDMREMFGQLRFSPRPRRSRLVRKYSWRASIQRIENGAGRLESQDADAEFAVDFHNADRLIVNPSTTEDIPSIPFTIGGVTVPAGAYRFANFRAAWAYGQTTRVAGTVSIDTGTFYSGRRTILALSQGRVELTRQLTLQPSFSVNWVDLREGAFTAGLAGARVIYTMTPLSFVSALVQYNSSTRTLAANLRFRWEYHPGSELFVVFNEQRDSLGTRATNLALANRAFIVKVNRLFRF
jgi:hypothetical protein